MHITYTILEVSFSVLFFFLNVARISKNVFILA